MKTKNGDMFQAPSAARQRVPVRMTAGGGDPTPERLLPARPETTRMQARRLRYTQMRIRG